LPAIVFDDNCPICMDEMTTRQSVVFTECNHNMHLSCFRTFYTLDRTPELRCPMCRRSIENISSGVVRPTWIGEDRMDFVQHPLALTVNRNHFYLQLNRTSGYTAAGYNRRLIFPIMSEIVIIPIIDAWLCSILLNGSNGSQLLLCQPVFLYKRTNWLFDFLISVYIMLTSHWYIQSLYDGTKEVWLLPSVVDDLQQFWSNKARTIENFDVSVIRCRNFLVEVDEYPTIISHTLDCAPLAALFRVSHTREVVVNWDEIFYKIIYFLFLMLGIGVMHQIVTKIIYNCSIQALVGSEDVVCALLHTLLL